MLTKKAVRGDYHRLAPSLQLLNGTQVRAAFQRVLHVNDVRSDLSHEVPIPQQIRQNLATRSIVLT